MTEEQFRREMLYQATLSIAHAMLRNSLISPSDLAKIEAMLKAKYMPLIGGLSPNNLDF